MSEDQAVILLVDDDKAILQFSRAVLEHAGHRILEAADGEQALALVKEQAGDIDVIVSDVKMPVMDGYAFCQALQAEEQTASIPFLFVSGLDSLEEKLKGFEVGGDDYITKPLEPQVLMQKIARLLETQQAKQSMDRQLKESFDTAMQAMTYSSDLGQILEFYKQSMAASDFAELSQQLFAVTGAYGLHCCIQFYTCDHTQSFSDQGATSPLEENIMELSRHQGRFFDFGTRTIINFDDFALLVKNMPLDEPDRYGTLKDSLGNLCNAVEARAKSLIADNKSRRMSQVVSTIRESMAQVGSAYDEIQRANMAEIEGMMDALEESMLTLGLTENQEEEIRQICQGCLNRSNEIFTKGAAVNDEFEHLEQRLGGILS